MKKVSCKITLDGETLAFRRVSWKWRRLRFNFYLLNPIPLDYMTENSNRLRHVLNMYYILNHSSSNPSVVYILIVTHPQNIFSFLCSNILRPRFALNDLDISYEDYRGRNHIFYFFFSFARKQFLDSSVSRVKHVLSHRLYDLQNIALRRIFHRIYNTITHPRLPLYRFPSKIQGWDYP